MDDIENQLTEKQKEDFLKLYSLLVGEGDLWVERVHSREKRLLEKVNLPSFLFVQYRAKIKQLEEEKAEKEKEIKQLKDNIDNMQECENCYISYISELEASIKQLSNKEKAPPSSFVGKGKSTEMPLRVVREVIRLWGLGDSIKAIEQETGASRWQIKRLLNGSFKSAASREKILKAINKLLKVNQNKDFIHKLNTLKGLYV